MANPIDTKSASVCPIEADPYWARIEKGAYLGSAPAKKTEDLARPLARTPTQQQYRPLGTQPNYDAAVALARGMVCPMHRGGAVEVPTVEQVCVAYVEALPGPARGARRRPPMPAAGSPGWSAGSRSDASRSTS